MSLTKTRAWVAGTVVLCLLLSLAAWFLLISPKRAEAADLREQTVAAEQANQQKKVKIEELKKEFANLPQRDAELAALRTAIPVDDQLSALTRTLEQNAGASGTALDSIAVEAPVSLTPAAPAAPAEGEGTSGSADSEKKTDTTDAAATPAPAAASTNLVRIPVTVTVTGDYIKSIAFLKTMQADMPRNFLVSGLTIGEPQVDAEGVDAKVLKSQGYVTMTITGQMFALPDTPAPAPAATASTANNS